MTEAEFVALVRDLLGAMGQRLEAARPVPEGLALRTQDGYLYVFVSDPHRGSLASVRAWCEREDLPMTQLVVFSLTELPDPWGPEVVRRGGTVVAGETFARLAEDLDIASNLLPRPGPGTRAGSAALPSARELEAQMRRADTWWTAGVFPLALRFYSSAAQLKPEYLPAQLGRARSLSGMERWREAREAWERVLQLRPGLIEAEIGAAGAQGASGDPGGERDRLATLVRAHPGSWDAQIAYLAALIEGELWDDARAELDRSLTRSGNDARLHFLLAVALDRTGAPEDAQRERERARALGLTDEEEARLRRWTAPPSHSFPSPPEGF